MPAPAFSRKSCMSNVPPSPISHLKTINNSRKIKRSSGSKFGFFSHSHSSSSTSSSDEYGSDRRRHLPRAVKVVPPSITRKSTDKKRGPRQLTARRIERIRIFLAEVAKNPDAYGEISSKLWISKLITCLDERKKNAVISSDVQRWLREYPRFFRDVRDHKLKEIKQAQHANKRRSSGISSCTVSPASEKPMSRRSSSSLSVGSASIATDFQEPNNRINVASKNGVKESVKVQEEQPTQIITGAEQPDEDNKLVLMVTGESSALPLGTQENGNAPTLYLPAVVVGNKLMIDTSMLGPPIFNATTDGKIIISGEFTLETICASIDLLQQNGMIAPIPTISQFLADERTPLPAITDGTTASSSVSVSLNGLLTLDSVRKGAEAMIKAVEHFRDAPGSSEGEVDWNSCFYALKFLESSLNK